MKKNHAISLSLCALLFPVALGLMSATASGEEEMEALPIVLPEEFYGGTPCEHWSPVFEPQDYKDRPPFMAPKDATNVALNKVVTASEPPVHGELKQAVDGDKHYARKSMLELPSGLQWVQVDLGQAYDIYAMLIWHFHEGKRVYFDVVVQVSDDANFKEGVKTVYNNDHDNSAGFGVGVDKEYIDDYKGRLMPMENVSGRYVRFYGQGNTADDFNHLIEVEVYGKPKS